MRLRGEEMGLDAGKQQAKSRTDEQLVIINSLLHSQFVCCKDAPMRSSRLSKYSQKKTCADFVL